MDILYIGNAQGFDNASKYYMIPQKLINGFTRNGHNVYVFNDRDYARSCNILNSSKLGIKKLNQKIIEVCDSFKPDLIVLGHCKHIHNETLEEIRKLIPRVKIIYRNVDPLHSAKNVADIMDRSGTVDGIFITTAGEEIRQFQHEKTFVAHMPNPVDSSIETGRAFENDGEYDLFFAGSFLRDQHDQRHDILSNLEKNLPEMKLGFFGANLGTKKIFGKEYVEYLKNSKMGLCLNKTSDYYLYASDRLSQYLGHGLLVFIDKGPRFEDLFNEDEMIFYDDEGDLIDKLGYYKANDKERREIAEHGWRKAHKIFNCELVTSFMIEKTFDLEFTNDYVWTS